MLPYFIIPYFLAPSFFPFGAFLTDGRTKFFTPCSLNKGFFLLSARGPTRRRNCAGQAVLWGGRPTELGTTNVRVYDVLPPKQYHIGRVDGSVHYWFVSTMELLWSYIKKVSTGW